MSQAMRVLHSDSIMRHASPIGCVARCHGVDTRGYECVPDQLHLVRLKCMKIRSVTWEIDLPRNRAVICDKFQPNCQESILQPKFLSKQTPFDDTNGALLEIQWLGLVELHAVIQGRFIQKSRCKADKNAAYGLGLTVPKNESKFCNGWIASIHCTWADGATLSGHLE